MSIAAIMRIAVPQHGCVSRNQLLSVVSQGELNSLVRKGVLSSHWPTVYVVDGFRNNWLLNASGIVLSVPGAVLSFGAAARLWGFDIGASNQIEFTTQGPLRYQRRNAIDHRTTDLVGFTDVRDGIDVTNVERTIIDLSRHLTVGQIGAMIDRARILNLSSATRVATCLDKLRKSGRRRTTLLDEALELRLANDKDIDSFLERKVLRWISSHGFPEPRTQHWFKGNRPYRLDIWYPELRLNIEPNGPWHLLPSINLEDQKRDIDLASRGILVMRVPVEMTELEFVRLLSTALASRKSG